MVIQNWGAKRQIHLTPEEYKKETEVVRKYEFYRGYWWGSLVGSLTVSAIVIIIHFIK